MANKQNGQSFTKNDLRLLTTFASQAAIAVDDANQFEKNRRRLIEFEILHEISNELPQLQQVKDFRNTLINKLSRVFPVDYSIWFNWDNENKILVTDGVSGVTNIPMTKSGKIDLKKITWEKVIIGPFDDQEQFNDINYLTRAIASKMKDSEFFPLPETAFMAIPIFRYGDLAYVYYLGAKANRAYSEDDISLAKLVISQSAILFEKEKSLLNATRLLTMGNMISEISHDLRRPLTTIKGGLQILRQRIDKEMQQAELFGNVEDEVTRMTELVKELVDFSNPKKYQTEKVDLRQLVKKASELVGPDLRKKNIEFTADFEEVDWRIIVNKNQILEIFLNLFINAVDAMSDGGHLKVQGLIEKPEHKKVDYLAIRVIDDGEGIKKENISKVFDRYFTTKSTGTGLGLAVVERIISAHDGTLKLDSDDGKGTTITVYMPYSS